MIRRQPKYSKEEFTQGGTALYEQKIRPLVEADHQDRIVVIDIDTGDYVVGDDQILASQPLIAKRPDAQLWCVRIGHRAVESSGGQPTKENP